MKKNIFKLMMLLFLSGCSAFGVVATNDPKEKINQAYYLLDSGRPLPAKKLFEEVIKIGEEKKDMGLVARGFDGLGDLYKVPVQYGVQKQNLTDYEKSASNYMLAAETHTKLGYTKKAAMSLFGGGWSAYKSGDINKSCNLFAQSAKSFSLKAVHKDDSEGFMDENKTPLNILANEYIKNLKCK